MVRGSKAGRLRVVLYHDILPADEGAFAAQLRWIGRRWRFIDTATFTAMITGRIPVDGDSVLLTFDDGFKSNLGVAQRILQPMHIKALFFVISEFVALSGSRMQREFFATHIVPGSDPAAHADSRNAMSWEDLRILLDLGHSIGGHTASHARLSDVAAHEDLEREITGSADTIGEILGLKVEHFAFPFGSLASFSAAALAIARQRFSCIYTGLRGDNARVGHPWAIRRDAVTPRDPLYLVGALLEGGADKRYRESLAEYAEWKELPATPPA